MRRTRARHVGRSVLSGATTPNRNGLVIAWNPRTRGRCQALVAVVGNNESHPTVQRSSGWTSSRGAATHDCRLLAYTYTPSFQPSQSRFRGNASHVHLASLHLARSGFGTLERGAYCL